MPVFLDTNVLLYCVDDREPDKRDRARRWVAACWQRQCGRLSPQVLNEYYVNVSKMFPRQLSQGDACTEIRRYQHWKPWAVDQPTVKAAWAVESRYVIAAPGGGKGVVDVGHGFNYWDALMIATAQQQGCTLLLTEDMQHGQQVDGLRVINPFEAGPELLDVAA